MKNFAVLSLLLLLAAPLAQAETSLNAQAAKKHHRPIHRPHRYYGGDNGFYIPNRQPPGDNDPALSNGSMCDSGTCFCNGEPITGGTLCQ